MRDFNSMANTTETLISSQRQLLYDVSHELRSPLARLNVALDLLRRRVGEVPALNRMQIDLQRLNETIGRLLTVAKLEASSDPAEFCAGRPTGPCCQHCRRRGLRGTGTRNARRSGRISRPGSARRSESPA